MALGFTEFTWIKLKGKIVPKAGPKIVTTCEVCAAVFERTPAFHRSAEAKGGKVRFCSLKCFGAAKTSGLVKVVGKGKPQFTCEMCNTAFERWPSFVKWAAERGTAVRFCSLECHGKARTAGLVELPPREAEAKRKSSDSNRRDWGLPAHSDELMVLSKGKRRTRVRSTNFTPQQRREWLDIACARCGTNDRLELDHIICVAAGGQSVRENAQTLCRPCNAWKMEHVDKPLVRQQSRSGG